MKRFSAICLTLVAAGLLLIPYALNAVTAPRQAVGGSASAKSPHHTIRMESQEVTVRLGKGSYTVEAVFQMANTGETITEWVGFPKGDELPGNDPSEFPDFTQFHVWVGGKEVQFSKEGKQWLAGHISFPRHATTTIRVLYEAEYYFGSSATYIVGTGSYWKDSIGKAAFNVDGSAIGGSKHFSANLNAPKSRRLLSDTALRIEAKDYEPDTKACLTKSVERPRPVGQE